MNGNGKHEYQVTQWRTCPHCGGNLKGCQQCYFGQIEVKVSLESALRDMGIIDQLALMQGEADQLKAQVDGLQKAQVLPEW
jgi:alkyl hydroperoxide reductase subunit AhpF